MHSNRCCGRVRASINILETEVNPGFFCLSRGWCGPSEGIGWFGLEWLGVGGRGKVKGNSYCIINPEFIHIHTYTHTHTLRPMITVLDLQCTIIAILPSFDSEDGAFVLASYHIASQRSHGHRTARKRASEHAHPRQKEK